MAISYWKHRSGGIAKTEDSTLYRENPQEWSRATEADHIKVLGKIVDPKLTALHTFLDGAGIADDNAKVALHELFGFPSTCCTPDND